jgi:restriction system protein
MQRQERNIALEVIRGAFAAIWLPFSWIAGTPAALVALVRRTGGNSQSAELASFDTGTWTLELLKRLEWRRFEELCAAYFEALGFRTEIAQSRIGGAVAIGLFAEGADNVSILVHCQAWNAYRVAVKPVRTLRDAMTSAGAVEGVLITSGRFTHEAVAAAAKENVQLIDGTSLLGKLTSLVPEKALGLLKMATQGDFLTPTCPACSIKMIPRRSTHEGRRFWGCANYPRCKHTLYGTANSPA